jgi:hypothetical protein
MDENAVGMCSELIFAPIDASFADDAPLVPSGFRIIPLDSIKVRLHVHLEGQQVRVGWFGQRVK